MRWKQLEILSLFGDLRDVWLTLVYPRACELCGRSVESLANGATCAECWAKTQIFDFTKTLCYKCGRLLERVGAALSTQQKTFCHRCDNDFYQIARAIGVYEGALRIAVLELKEQPFVSAKIQDLLVQAFNQLPLNQATAIVPVPLHPKRFSERGFNQAAILAQSLSKRANLPILENCLAREIYTKQHRGAMDERSRRESVEKAFVVKQPRLLKSQRILLIDDVFTSGATASVCAHALIKNGASEVFVLTVARAV